MTTQYTGTFLSDLAADVEAAHQRVAARLAKSAPLEFVDNMESCLRGYYDPALFLADAKSYLADRVMEPGDPSAWCELDDLQELLWSAKHTCRAPVECGQSGYPCGQKSVAFCRACQTEICSGHMTRENGKTLCLACDVRWVR